MCIDFVKQVTHFDDETRAHSSNVHPKCVHFNDNEISEMRLRHSGATTCVRNFCCGALSGQRVAQEVSCAEPLAPALDYELNAGTLNLNAYKPYNFKPRP